MALVLFLSCVINSSATVLYVDLNCPTPTPPYTNWIMAATDIQSAIDSSTDGDLILVTNGIYQAGGRTVNGYALTNRVVINKAVTVQSVNGLSATIIQGYQVPGSTNGDGAVRCVYMTNNATLIGFTLANGATRTNGDFQHEDCGGGIWCEPTNNAVICNCFLVGNTAKWDGGGVAYGTFSNSTFTANSAGPYGYGGGAYASTLNYCLLTGNSANYGGGANSGILNNCNLTNNSAWAAGGGVGSAGIAATLNTCILAGNTATLGGGVAHYSTLNNCLLTGNTATGNGGGAYGSTLNNCMIISNWVPSYGYGGGTYQATLNNCTLIGNCAGQLGGGSYYGTLNNCLLTGNYVTSGTGGGSYYGTLNNCTVTGNSAAVGGGTYFSTLNNCIVYFNTAPQFPNYYRSNLVSYCCTIPYAGPNANITNDPAFVDFIHGNFRLQSNSPCINSGNNGYAGTTSDLDGNPRIVGGAVDIGAYEFQTPAFTLPFLYAQQYGIPIDGSVDSDGDGMSNWQEWIAGTDPTNPSSVLKMFPPSKGPSWITVSWQSVIGKVYFLQASTNLAAQPAFSTGLSYI